MIKFAGNRNENQLICILIEKNISLKISYCIDSILDDVYFLFYS